MTRAHVMGWSQPTKWLVAGVAGVSATLVFYVALLVLQNENADYACESPQEAPGVDVNDLRGIGFENTFLNLGGRCEYRLENGSVIVTREPGWWFSATIGGFVAVIAVVVIHVARRKGHPGLLYGLTALLAPPLGFALAVAAPCRA